ncbi:unnamed protein product [Lepidochelys olivacea]
MGWGGAPQPCRSPVCRWQRWAREPGPDPGGRIQALRAELAAALAEVETLRAVATVSEGTKQEAVATVRRHCQEEVASLQAILKDTISSYEARLAALQQEQHGGGSWGGRELSCLQQQRAQGNPLDSLERQMEKAQEDSEQLRSIVLPMEEEIAQLKSKLSRAEGLIQGCGGLRAHSAAHRSPCCLMRRIPAGCPLPTLGERGMKAPDRRVKRSWEVAWPSPAAATASPLSPSPAPALAPPGPGAGPTKSMRTRPPCCPPAPWCLRASTCRPLASSWCLMGSGRTCSRRPGGTRSPGSS